MIDLCTFTGLDNKTDLGRVIEMSERYHFLEFGVLLSRTPEDKDARYPIASEIATIVHALAGRTRIALHVCGRAVSEYMRPVEAGTPFLGQDITDLVDAGVGRVQFNFNFSRAGLAVEEIDAAIGRTKANVITQHFPSNVPVSEGVTSPNHNVLYDASGGRGVEATGLNMPFASKYTGYAGGIGPENALEKAIEIDTLSGDTRVWIDMENRIRTEGYLDLDKCEAVARAVGSVVRLPNGV